MTPTPFLRHATRLLVVTPLTVPFAALVACGSEALDVAPAADDVPGAQPSLGAGGPGGDAGFRPSDDGGAAPGPEGGADATAPQTTASLAGGHQRTCALGSGGSVKCWGSGSNGFLGLGRSVESLGSAPGQMGTSLTAVDLGPGFRATGLAVGVAHACALSDAGTVKCWGFNRTGCLGLGDETSRGDQAGQMGAALPVVDLGPGVRVRSIAAGGNATCAIATDGTLRCWGENGGRLGAGYTSHVGTRAAHLGANLAAIDLGPGRTVASVAMGGDHTCALLDDASLKCWGLNGWGQLGLGDLQARGDQPGEMGAALPSVDLGPGVIAKAVYAGEAHTCVVATDGTVRCWGSNEHGQLGLPGVAFRGGAPGDLGAGLVPVDLGAGKKATSLALGSGHTCARLDDGTVKGWGGNLNGELGLGDAQGRGKVAGSLGDALPAADLGPGRRAVSLDAGWWHTCARLDDGSVRCWGRNAEGELGLGDLVSRGNRPGQMGASLPAVSLW